ncbi:MFS-type transporter SLC18B1-like [Watersipora subatra]|uniref:MFS-type transporter SLC18B1-like n=1 Tax=Watersipora subatra TaxID=2589382 RepID=UPI00355C1821
MADEERTNNSATPTTETNQVQTGSYTRTEWVVLAACLTAQFLSNVCASLPAPFLPYMDESHNVGSSITGWIIGLLPLTQIFVCPLYGKLVAYVKVRSMLITGLFVCGNFTIFFGMLDYYPLPERGDDQIDTSYVVLEVSLRIMQSLGSGAILIAAMTMLTTTFPTRTTTILSYSQMAVGLGYMVGPAIGSGLFAAGQFVTVFAGVGFILVTIAIISWFALPKEADVRLQDNTSTVSYKTVLSDVNTISALILTAFVGTLFSCIEPILEPELREQYGLSVKISAIIFVINGLTYTASAPVVGKILDSWSWLNSLHLMVAGFLLNTINFLFMGPSPILVGLYRPLWLMLLCLAIMGVTISFVLVPSLDLLSFNSSKSETEFDAAKDKAIKAMLSGLWSSAYALGDFLGPTYSGIMTQYFGFACTMTSMALACFLAAILIILIKICNRRRTDGETEPLIP